MRSIQIHFKYQKKKKSRKMTQFLIDFTPFFITCAHFHHNGIQPNELFS